MRSRLVHTPRYDAWLARLRIRLEPAGAKTELAQFMAGQRNQSLQVWKVNLARILRTGSIINAEDLLTITEWMETVVGTTSLKQKKPATCPGVAENEAASPPPQRTSRK